MAEDISDYGQNYSHVSVTPENTESLDYILQNYLTLSLIPFCTSIFCKNRVLNFTKLFSSIFVIFLCFCKDPKNSIGVHLKSCYNFVFLCFKINKVTGEPKQCQQKYKVWLILQYLNWQINLNIFKIFIKYYYHCLVT